MLVLLPPSEGKAAPRSGGSLDLGTLVFGELTARRERLLDNLERLATRKLPTALKALKLSPGLAGEVARDGQLRTAPAAAAHEVYTGVLYEHLRPASLSGAARERILIASALWGMVRADDVIPAYRLSMQAQLPRVGALAGYWRDALRRVIPDEGLIVDMRSGTYASAWAPSAATLVKVRGFVEADGKRTVVSHMVKATRGDVARVLLSLPQPPSDPQQIAHAVEEAGHRVELTPAGAGWSLDVILQ